MRRAVSLVLIGLLMVGCSQAPTQADDAAAKTEVKGDATAAGNKGGAAPTTSDPSTVKDPNAAVQMAPPDPNDPKFKADPKLAGGG